MINDTRKKAENLLGNWEKHMKDEPWWDAWLLKMNKYMEERQKQELKPRKAPATDMKREIERVRVEEPWACSGCGEDTDYCSLDRNMFCPKCVERSAKSDNGTGVKLGNPEAAFYFHGASLNDPEIRVVKCIDYLECPERDHSRCRYDVTHLREVKDEVRVYSMLLDHYIKEHYELEKREHTKWENLCYAIMQQFVIYEANMTKKEKGPKHKHDCRLKRALAMHNLMKHLQIPLNILGIMCGGKQREIGLLAFDGISLCNSCSNK